jgi:hypothetical protein
MGNTHLHGVEDHQVMYTIHPLRADVRQLELDIDHPDSNDTVTEAWNVQNYSLNELRTTGIYWCDLTILKGVPIADVKLYLYGSGGGVNGNLYFFRILPRNAGWTGAGTWNFADGDTLRWTGDVDRDGGIDGGCSVFGVDHSANELGSGYYEAYPLGYENVYDLDVTEFAALVVDNCGFVLRRVTFGSATTTQPLSANDYYPQYRPKLVVTFGSSAASGNTFVYEVTTSTEPEVGGTAYLYNVRSS